MNSTKTKTPSKSTASTASKPKTTTSNLTTPSSDKKPTVTKTPVKKITSPTSTIEKSNKLEKPKPAVTKAPSKLQTKGIEPEPKPVENPPLAVKKEIEEKPRPSKGPSKLKRKGMEPEPIENPPVIVEEQKVEESPSVQQPQVTVEPEKKQTPEERLEFRAEQLLKGSRYADDEEIDVTAQTSEFKSEENIELRMKMQRDQVKIFSNKAQKIPMLVSIIAEMKEKGKRAPIDLVCVIDRSQSMEEQGKIELLINSFTYLLSYLDENDRICVIRFNHMTFRIGALKRATPENKEILMEKIKDTKPSGATNMTLGMMHAFATLNQRRFQNPISSIFLLTDGLDSIGNVERNMAMMMDRFNVPQSTIIHTFGFGIDHDAKLMADIADMRDGNFYFIEQLDMIDETFIDCLGGLLSTISHNVELKVKQECFKIDKAYGDEKLWEKKTDKEYVTMIGSMVSGSRKDFVFDIEIAKGLKYEDRKVKVASAEAIISTLMGEKVVKKAELYVEVLGENEGYEGEDDKEVMRNHFRVRGAECLNQARIFADSRNYENAKKILVGFNVELGKSVLAEEEFIQNLMKDIERAVEDVKPNEYVKAGKLNLYQSNRAQMRQKSNLKSNNGYQNEVQAVMIQEVKMKKKK